jgi:hypothetical protein
MKKTHSRRSLVLRTEAIRALTVDALLEAAGGRPTGPTSGISQPGQRTCQPTDMTEVSCDPICW